MALSGCSQTDLISEAIADQATAIIREQRHLALTDRDIDALPVTLAEPAPPNDAMRRSIACWREHGAPV